MVSDKRKLVLVWIGALFVIILFIVGFFLLTGDKTNLEYVDHHSPYNDGWSLTLNEKEIGPVTLPYDVVTNQGNSAVFSKVLPDEIEDCTAIISRNYHQRLQVFIDGKLVFSYPPKDWNGIGNLISDEWNMIPLLPEYAGKTIEFSLTNNTMFKFTAHVGEFYYGEDNSLVQFIRGNGFIGVIEGVIVCIIAGLLLIVSYIYRNHTNQAQNTAMGVALLCFGIWITNRAKMCLFPNNSIYIYACSLVCLMLVAPFVFLYSYYRNKTMKRFALWGFRACLLADIFLMISCFFIKYDVEIIASFAYILCIVALALTSYSLFIGGFSKKAKLLSKTDRLLNQTEFFASLIIPLFAVFEFTFYHDLLWTDASKYLRMGILLYAIAYMCFVLWRTFLVVQDRTIVTKKLHESELELMMGQIQPHFIFNTLSSIRTLIKVDPDLSYDMIYNFSNYLRANIDNVTNMDGIKFSAEVEHIQNYVNIEKVRFGERLNVEYDIQAGDFIVPPLSIQPLVENAIKHGIRNKPGVGIVTLKSYETPDFNIVEVNDTGIGFNRNSANKVFFSIKDDMTSVGIKSLTLLDALGRNITVSDPADDTDENEIFVKSDRHQSQGMKNILLRLKEMSNAAVEIFSQESMGTSIKVYFPKNNSPF